MFQVSTHHWSSQSALFPKQWSDCPKARAAKVKGPQWLNEESPHDHFIARAWTLAQISASSLRRALLSVWASLTCMHFPLLLLSAQCRLRPRLNCVPTRRQNTDHQNHQTQIGLKISLEVHVFQAPARLQTALPILQTYNLSIFFFLHYWSCCDRAWFSDTPSQPRAEVGAIAAWYPRPVSIGEWPFKSGLLYHNVPF